MRKIAFIPLAWLVGSLLGLLSLAPTLLLVQLWLYAFNNGWMLAGIAISVAAMPALVVLTCLWIAMIKAVVLRRAKPGIYPLYSFYYSEALAGLRAHAFEPRPVVADLHHDLPAAVDAPAWREDR